MDIRKVKKLIELLEESNDVCEIEIHEDKESVRISRNTTVQTPAPTMHTVQAPFPQPSQAPTQEPAAIIEEEQGTLVRAPMVGTFFSAPSPESDPFIKVGDQVSQGDTLFIIEAMKIMNQIEAPVDGKIKTIFAKNGDPLEFDQALILIE